MVRESLGVQPIPHGQRTSRPQDPRAFPPGGGGQPARQRGRVAQAPELSGQVDPDRRADVFGVSTAQPMPTADRPDQRGVPVHERVPRLLLAAPGQRHQVRYRIGSCKPIAHRVTVPFVPRSSCFRQWTAGADRSLTARGATARGRARALSSLVPGPTIGRGRPADGAAGGMMHARILGPFQLDEGGRTIPMGGTRQRAVLVSLLLRVNEVVPSEQLLMDLWGEDSPLSAANSLQAAISRLRRVLPQGRLITRAPGYALRMFPEELDVSQFDQLVFQGREALTAGAAEQAARTLRQALSLWQGPALADFRYEPFAQADIVRLEELHLTCLEERIEADLARALTSILVPELRRLIHDHPMRERLRGQLMRALYLNGQQAEALEVYHDFRSVLRDELGLDPSPQLRELEEAILRHDSVASPLTAATEAPLARRAEPVVCVLSRVGSDRGLPLDPEAFEVVNE